MRPESAPGYRPDVDGLRAVAVLAVIGFHAFPEAVPGGFVGVDVFFVISGFLITGIILRRLDRGSFGFAGFYARRIRRIFPALVLVLGVCWCAGWFTLLSDEFAQLGKHVAGGAGFVSNLLFWQEAGYFDNAAETKPLLHLWSLGVEEQYYLIWPPLLYIAWKIRLSRLALTVVLLATSFALNVSLVHSDAVAMFYSPAARFWELSLGGVLACLALDDEKRRLVSLPRDLLSCLGVALIGASVFVLNKGRAFPGWWALLPTVGAFLVMSAGREAWLNRRILSHPVVVWVGLISFPLYLWHWPILSFLRILDAVTPPAATRVAAVLVSVALASLTYKLVETPFRFGAHGARNVAVLCVAGLAIGGAGYRTFQLHGVPGRVAIANHDNERVTRGWDMRLLTEAGTTDCSSVLKDIKYFFCASTLSPNVAIVGDSHAGHLFWGFTHNADPYFSKAIVIGAGSCPPALDTENRPGCTRALLEAFDMVKRSPKIGFVLLGAYYDLFATVNDPFAKELFKGYLKTFKTLDADGKRVVFVRDPPTLKSDPDICIPRRPVEVAYPNVFRRPGFCAGASEGDLRSHAAYDLFVEALAKAAPEVLFYDPAEALCTGGTCKVFEGGKLLYGDFNHFSIYGSEYVVRDLVSKIKADHVADARFSVPRAF